MRVGNNVMEELAVFNLTILFTTNFYFDSLNDMKRANDISIKPSNLQFEKVDFE